MGCSLNLHFYVTEQILGLKKRDTIKNSLHSFPNPGKFADSEALEKRKQNFSLGTFEKRPCDNTKSMYKLPRQSDSVGKL